MAVVAAAESLQNLEELCCMDFIRDERPLLHVLAYTTLQGLINFLVLFVSNVPSNNSVAGKLMEFQTIQTFNHLPCYFLLYMLCPVPKNNVGRRD